MPQYEKKNMVCVSADQTLQTYKSRRNHVRLIRTDMGQCVEKTFSSEEELRRELQIYRMLQDRDIPCAKLIMACDNALYLTQLPGQNLVDLLELQEQSGMVRWEIWEKLVAWMADFQRQTGFVMTDVNLRNFLYDEKTGMLFGLDFEECVETDILMSAGRIAAYIRTYRPENTQLKQKISGFVLHRFADICNLDMELLLQESGHQEAALMERRRKKNPVFPRKLQVI